MVFALACFANFLPHALAWNFLSMPAMCVVRVDVNTCKCEDVCRVVWYAVMHLS